MRNNNTYGTNYPTGSIGRYSTEELKEMKDSSNGTIKNTHIDGTKNKIKNEKSKD